MKFSLTLLLVFLSLTLLAAESLPEMKPLRGKCNLASTPKRPPTIGFGEGAKGVLMDNIKINTFR